MGVKLNKLEFVKLFPCIKYRFVDFGFQRKGSVVNSIAVVKILLPSVCWRTCSEASGISWLYRWQNCSPAQAQIAHAMPLGVT